LAEHIQRVWQSGLQIERLSFKTGRRLAHGELSRSGLYAITSTRPDDNGEYLTLRITMFPDIAALLTPDRWREVRECWLS
jgi:hypothetical protein